MSESIRQPAVAGAFYPGQAKALEREVLTYLSNRSEQREFVKAVMLPHAGYCFCGEVIGSTLAEVEIPDTVILLGPKHTRFGERTAIMTTGSWSFPGFEVPIHETLATLLAKEIPEIQCDSIAHAKEHGLEVLLPFLRACNPKLRFVPIVLGYRSFEEAQAFGKALAIALSSLDEQFLIVISSDMNHFEDQETTKHKDQLALEHFLTLESESLYRVCEQESISMCGVIPACSVLSAGSILGYQSAELCSYRTSAMLSGDYEQVVGYAGAKIR